MSTASSLTISLFECTCCYELISPPIYQCKNGHLVCSYCENILFRCPTCRGTYGQIRNLAMEKIGSTLKFLCKYSTLGCNVSSLYMNKANHEAECDFKPYFCPCPGAKCKWQGFLQQVMPHLRISHKYITLEGEKIVFRITNINTSGPNTWAMVQSYFGHNFLLALHKQEKYPGQVRFFAFVQLIGSNQQAEVFAYRLELNGQGRRLIWEGPTRSIREGIHSTIFNSDCLVLDTSILNWYTENDMLGINVTISMV